MGKVRLPRLVLYLLTSIPLIIFEEDIDCQVAWCGRVVIPPTLPFLLIEMFALGAIATLLHARSARNVTLAFCIYGVFYELVFGGLRGISLSGFAILIVPYVALGYAYVSLLPLTVLLEGKGSDSTPLTSADVSESAHSIVLRIVLDLGQSHRFHHRWHVHAEAAAKTLLQAIPATHWILRRASPGFNCTFGRSLLLVRAAQQHPISVLLERSVKIIDAAEIVSKLSLANGHNECRRG